MEKQEKTVLPRSERLEDIRAWILTVLLIPILIPVLFVLGYFLTFVFIGAVYVGPMLGLMAMALLWPLFKKLRIPKSVTDKVQIGIFAITCPFGVFFMVSTLWR